MIKIVRNGAGKYRSCSQRATNAMQNRDRRRHHFLKWCVNLFRVRDYFVLQAALLF